MRSQSKTKPIAANELREPKALDTIFFLAKWPLENV